MVNSWPDVKPDYLDKKAEAAMGLIIDLVTSIRNIRVEMGVPHSQKVDVLLSTSGSKRLTALKAHAHLIKDLVKVGEITVGSRIKKPSAAATAIVKDVEVFIPLEGVIDLAVEKERLSKRLADVKREIEKRGTKLKNEAFLKKAPPEVVAREEMWHAACKDKKEKLESNIQSLG